MADLYRYQTQEFLEITNPGENGRSFRLVADVVLADKIGSPEEKSESTQLEVDLSITGTLMTMWSRRQKALKKNENMLRVLYEFGRRHLEVRIKSGETTGNSNFTLSSMTGPTECPFDPARIKIDHDKVYSVEAS